MINKEMLLHIFKVLSAIIFSGTTVKSHGCTNYTVLSDATRSLSYYDNSQRHLCDKNLETKWYRFMGQALEHHGIFVVSLQLLEDEVGNLIPLLLYLQITTSVRMVLIIVMLMRHVLILMDHLLVLVTMDIVETE